MNLLKLYLLIVMLSLTGCSTINTYQEPDQSTQNYAVVRLENPNLVSDLLGAVIMKPMNGIEFDKIDGQNAGFLSGHEFKVKPGKHTITVHCSTNGNVFDTKTFILYTAPGRIYTIAYPDYLNMQGFTVDTTACKKLILKLKE